MNTADRVHYLAIFFIAFSGIAFQILLTRIFSVTLNYHFAFAGITFAMLGITVGALKVYMNPKRFADDKVDYEIGYHAFIFSLCTLLAVLFFADIPGRFATRDFFGMTMHDSRHYGDFFHAFGLSKLSLIISIPFIISSFIYNGACIALLLTRFPQFVGKLYAADLVGAATACIAVMLGLEFLDPISILMIILTIIAWGAYKLVQNTINKRKRYFKIWAVILLILTSLQTLSYINQETLFKVNWSKNTILSGKHILFEKWNSFSHVSVQPRRSRPFGWGNGKMPGFAPVPQRWLQIDAGAATVLTKFDGDTRKVGFLKYDMVNLAYHVRRPDEVAVIGVGGGRDLLAALVFGAKHVTGIEMNPTITDILTNHFSDFTGNLHLRTDVTLVNAEARSFLNSDTMRYDLIQIPAIDTWSALASGGLTLTENTLYTVEAWKDFLNSLTDKGILSVNRGFRKYQPAVLYRLTSIAVEALKEIDPNIDPKRHILIANIRGSITIMLSKSPFSEEEVLNFTRANKKMGFKTLASPHHFHDSVIKTIISRKADQSFYDKYSADFSPSTDDRPYFFNHVRLLDFFSEPYAEKYTLERIRTGSKILIYCLVGTLLVAFMLIGWPLVKLYRVQKPLLKTAKPNIIYFACIGLGFMFIEMSQMQRLMIFLGHPVYGLAVVLFTLLLFSGIGSYTVRHIHNNPLTFVLARPLILCLLLVITGLITPLVTEYIKYYGVSLRIIASIALLIPISLFMGMLFPLGINMNHRNQELLPWYWGINGIMSVLASVLAVIISMNYGITSTYWLGVLCYVVCVIALHQVYLNNKKQKIL